jgi:hypothetical protein
MGSWHTTILSCHCDNPLVVGTVSKKKISYVFIKRIVTVGTKTSLWDQPPWSDNKTISEKHLPFWKVRKEIMI